jgi:hypothetical protein
MRAVLTLHPDSRSDAVSRIEAEVARPQPHVLALRYVLTGSLDRLVLPAMAEPARSDGLWRHTCFEAFLRAGSDDAYFEFNFAPSWQWAAYRFDAYRTGMRAAEEIEPAIATGADDGQLELQASLTIVGRPGDAAWRLGLSAVIEEANGHLSYWALRHPPGRPDFHRADSFVLALPIPQTPTVER